VNVRTVEIGDATESLAEYAQRADLGPVVVVTVEGRPIAAVVPVEGADLESLALGVDPGFAEIIERSRSRQAREGGISSEEMRRLLESEE
jgi:prevent-host-death family protein